MGCGTSSADVHEAHRVDGKHATVVASGHNLVVTVEQKISSRLGMAILSGSRDSPLVITQVCDRGLIPDWNAEYPEKAVNPGDRIISVNGHAGGAFATRDNLHEFRKTGPLTFVVERGDGQFQASVDMSICEEDQLMKDSWIHDLPRPRSDEKKDHTCVICLEDLVESAVDKEVVRLPGCGHMLHLDCAVQCFMYKVLASEAECPMCRRKLFITQPMPTMSYKKDPPCMSTSLARAMPEEVPEFLVIPMSQQTHMSWKTVPRLATPVSAQTSLPTRALASTLATTAVPTILTAATLPATLPITALTASLPPTFAPR